jgi:hypothetical protein
MITITEISTKRPIETETFTRKDGTPGSSFCRWVKIEGNDNPVKVKSFNRQFLESLQPGQHNVKSEYKGTYTLEAPKKPFGGGRQRPQYTLEEYNKLFEYGLDHMANIIKCSDNPPFREAIEANFNSFFATWFIGAKDCGIKV